MKTITGKEASTLREGSVFRVTCDRVYCEDARHHGWMIKGPTTASEGPSYLVKVIYAHDLQVPVTKTEFDECVIFNSNATIEVMEPVEVAKIARFWSDVRKANPLPVTVPVDTPEKPKYEHVDELLNDYYGASKNPALRYAYWFFLLARLPAAERSIIHPFIKEIKLFVDYEGKTYRVTGASRYGDIYLTSDFNKDTGYEQRVNPDVTKLTGWRATPSPES